MTRLFPSTFSAGTWCTGRVSEIAWIIVAQSGGSSMVNVKNFSSRVRTGLGLTLDWPDTGLCRGGIGVFTCDMVNETLSHRVVEWIPLYSLSH